MADDFSATISTKARLIFDTPASGFIEAAGDTDWFKITLAAGQKIQCDLEGSPTHAGTLSNPFLGGIYDSHGSLIPNTSNDNFGGNANAQVTFTASAAGDYFIAAGAVGSGTGSYKLGVTDMTSRLRIDATDATLDEGNSSTTPFTFMVIREGDASAPASATWTVSGSSANQAGASDFIGSVFPSGTVHFAAGENSATINVNVHGDRTLERDEGFKVSLSNPQGAILETSVSQTTFTEFSYSEAGVSESFYTLSGSGGTFSVSADAEASVGRAEIYVNGVLKAASRAYLPFSGSLSIPATTDLQANDLIDVVLVGADGQLTFDFTVSYGPGLRSASTIAAGTIVNDEPTPDDYPGSRTTTGVLPVGGGVVGNIDTAGDNDWFGIPVIAGESYLFNLDATAQAGITDPYLKLYNASGSLLDSDDDHGAGSAAQIAYTATSTGKVFLAASSAFTDEVGQYQLYATRLRAAVNTADDYTNNTTTSGRVTAGGTAAAGKIDTPGDSDWFAVSLVAGQATTFALEAAKFSPLSAPHLDAFSAAGKLIVASNFSLTSDLSTITLNVAQSGIYYLAASSDDPLAGTGNYLLSADTSGSAPFSTGSTAPKLVSLASTATAFDGVANVALTLTFDKPIERGNGGIILETASGTFLEGFDAASSSRLAVSGSTVTITPHAILSGTGQYNLLFAPRTFEDLAGHSWAGNTSIPILTPLADTATLLFGSNGNDVLTGSAGLDILICNGTRNNFFVSGNVNGVVTIQDKSGATGTDTISAVEKIQFDDLTVNLRVQTQAATLKPTDLNSLIELYIAYINRVPDAEGMSYWIDQFNAGKTMNEIGNSFYSAAVQYASLTGYSTSMTNAEFVSKIYENVLARTGATAPPSADVDYWANNLASGVDTKGTLVKTMLRSAHSFKGDATWGWVANLLDNKVEIGRTFAISDGLTFNTAEDSISHGIAIAAAITASDLSPALALIGVTNPFLQTG